MLFFERILIADVDVDGTARQVRYDSIAVEADAVLAQACLGTVTWNLCMHHAYAEFYERSMQNFRWAAVA